MHTICRTTFCLSPARYSWLTTLPSSLALRVMADNGADVYINGVKLVTDSGANHNPVFYNNEVAVPPTSPAFVPGVCGRVRAGL